MTTIKTLASEATGPLKGVRILDLTSVLNGPYATQILADQGCDVIKVEEPGGDIGRLAGDVPEGAPRDLGPLFLNINRNKRSIVLDLKTEADRATLLAIAATCDAFVTSVRYEALKRLRLDYEALKAARPDIIYAHAAGYGSEGLYAGEPAYDDLIQSVCGLADLAPRATDDDPAPRLLPTVLADKVCGLLMAQAVTAALYSRKTTGQGQFVEVPMLECMTSFVMVEHLYDQAFTPPTGPYGYPRVLNPNRKPYRTRDGYIGLLPYTDKQWDLFFEAADFGDVVKTDPRFATYTARGQHIRELYGLVEQVVATKTTAEWLALLKPLSIPVVKTNRLDEVEDDPHIRSVGLFETYEHPDVGMCRQIRPPVKFSGTPSNIRRHPPRLGEDAGEILAEVEEAAREN